MLQRITDPWFEFAGVKNTTLGVMLLAMPQRQHAARRGDYTPPIPGRDGNLWRDGGGYDNITVPVQCYVENPSNISTVMNWLTGLGYLRFSDDPDRAYRARVTKTFNRSPKMARFTAQEFTVTFDCHPSRFVYPIPTIILVSGMPVTNSGTQYAEPKITLTGSGDIALTIGAQTLNVTGLASKIALDMEARVAYNPDDTTQNLCSTVSGDWPLLIQPGSNAVSWTGTVSAVSMVANWRDI